MKMTRRFFASLLIIVAPLLLSVGRTSGDNSKATQYFAFIGTYTAKTDSKGIYSFRFDSSTGRLTATNSETTLSAALTRLSGKGGEPLIRRGVDMAMRMMGEQFVLGQTIDEAVTRGRRMEAKGFR